MEPDHALRACAQWSCHGPVAIAGPIARGTKKRPRKRLKMPEVKSTLITTARRERCVACRDRPLRRSFPGGEKKNPGRTGVFFEQTAALVTGSRQPHRRCRSVARSRANIRGDVRGVRTTDWWL